MPNLLIDISAQALVLMSAGKVMKVYSISTAKNGCGEKMDSECTPRGKHVIAEKIGAGCQINAVFVSREPTGEIFNPAMLSQEPERDWILTRILWLRGTESGVNQGGDVDSYNRHIYIHGAPDDVVMGEPGSHGCIRMRNEDVVELFELVEVGVGVVIKESLSSGRQET